MDEEACHGEGLRVGATGPEECGALVDSAGDETKVRLISSQSSWRIYRFGYAGMSKHKLRTISPAGF